MISLSGINKICDYALFVFIRISMIIHSFFGLLIILESHLVYGLYFCSDKIFSQSGVYQMLNII